jgi:primosomal protein N' (replication factor Y)
MTFPVAKVAVDIALDREFDYLIPKDLKDTVKLGSRVSVPFSGRRRTGYVVGLAERSSVDGLKSVVSTDGESAFLDDNLLEIVRWMADY